MTDPKSSEKQIRDAVVEGYLEHGKALDAVQIAERLGWSESKVRRILRDSRGFFNDLSTRQEGRQSYSRSYPGMEAGAHMVWVYSPTLQALRAMVLELRAAAVVGAAAPVQDPK